MLKSPWQPAQPPGAGEGIDARWARGPGTIEAPQPRLSPISTSSPRGIEMQKWGPKAGEAAVARGDDGRNATAVA